MIRYYGFSKGLFLILIASFLLAACAKSPYIKVNYRLPEKSDTLTGKKVIIEIKDLRDKKAFLGNGALPHFKYFTDRFSLSLSQTGKDLKPVGNFDALSMLQTAFKIRMVNMGLIVLDEKTEKEPLLEIMIQTFLLDLRDSKWISSLKYTARVRTGAKSDISETVSATVERHKIIGQKEVDKALGEMVTDAVNQLNVQRLLQH